MSKNYNVEDKNLREIFGTYGIFYSIPDYQRPYAWNKDHVEQLWFDIVTAYLNNKEDSEMDQDYFLGSIVLSKDNINTKNTLSVVDGQQRLTTLTILLCVLRDIFSEDEISEVLKIHIIDQIGKQSKIKLSTHDDNQLKFQKNVIEGINFNISVNHTSDNKYLQNALYFYDLINKSKNPIDNDNYIEDFIDFINYLMNNVILIVIECQNADSAIKLFHVLNDRGMDLEPSDIIKSHLLNIEQNDDNRKIIIAEWRKIELKLSSYEFEKLTDILNLYLYHLKTENPKKSLQDELHVFIKEIKPINFIDEFNKFIDYYLEIVDDITNKHISSLKYLNHSVYWKSILTSAKYNNFENYDELLELLKKYYFQSWITDGTANRVKQTSFNILKIINNKKNKNVEDVLDSKIEIIKSLILKNLMDHKHYLEYLDSNNCYSKKWLKSILLMIEYEYHENDDINYNKSYIPITKTLHVEHIMPQEYKEFYPNITLEEAISYINSIGNLTLLTYKKNSAAGKLNYESKKSIFKGEGKSKGITTFEITKDLINTYPNWDIENIKNRKLQIINKIKNILDI